MKRADVNRNGKTNKLPPLDPNSGDLNTIIETPKGSRNKYKYDETTGMYMLSNVLPCGSLFPYDFGFIPSTKGGDGDPLDVLLLMEEAAFPGCLIPSRIIGVIEAMADGKRNDRLVVVTKEGEMYSHIKSLRDLPKERLHEIQQFFVSYHRTEGKDFKLLGIKGPKRAMKILESSQIYKRRSKSKRT
jgi:inorganic pyrophosphatase